MSNKGLNDFAKFAIKYQGKKHHRGLPGPLPSYESIQRTKPKNENPWHRPPMPIKFVSCIFCHKQTGTLLRHDVEGKRGYAHSECILEHRKEKEKTNHNN